MINYYPALEPGAHYHVFNRGNNRENLFPQARNYTYFLHKYALYLSGALDTYAYNLLPNHFHLLVRVKPREEMLDVLRAANVPGLQDLERLDAGEIVSQLFRRCFMAYAKAINKQDGRVGSLFQKNFKRLRVRSEGHFTNLIYYIHANAQLHGLCKDFRQWPYSSYHSYLSSAPTRLMRQPILHHFGSLANFEAYHRQYVGLKGIESLMIED